jgi:DNA repair protein RadD
MKLRPYQRAAVDAVFAYWQNGGGDPLVEMATGTGKSLTIATLARELVEMGARVLMLVHVKELVAQNAQAMLRAWPGAPLGINSAGLNRRDRHSKILFASIQSVARDDHHSLGTYDVIVIDEAHLLPPEGEGQYRKLIARLRSACPDLRVVGFTATPFRLGSGLLHGHGAPFDDLIFSYGIADGISDGYLSPLTSKGGASEIDVTGVKRSGGEFVEGALASASSAIIPEACADMVARLADRRAWVVFCAGVANAELTCQTLRGIGVNAACVTGNTPAFERDRILKEFREGRIRCVTNANLLIAGFDAPVIDAVVMLRPTNSTSLYIQQIGRGTRLFEGKQNCLVLDYAGNVRRHGPVDAIEIRGREPGKKGDEGKASIGDVRAKECPECKALVAIQTMKCPDCEHEWQAPEAKITARPDVEVPVITSELANQWLDCDRVDVFRHEKTGGVASLRVEYRVGLSTYKEWVTLDHPSFPGHKAERWWVAATGMPILADKGAKVEAALRDWRALGPKSVAIQIERDGKYWRVKRRRFERLGKVTEFVDEPKYWERPGYGMAFVGA